MCPSPRPDSCGTATPYAATSGASGSVILSPTPPVECLSTVGLSTLDRSSRSPEAIIAAVQRASSASDMPRSSIAISQRRHLLLGHRTPGVRVDHPVDLGVRQRAAVPLGPDDVDRVNTCPLLGQLVRRSAGRPALVAGPNDDAAPRRDPVPPRCAPARSLTTATRSRSSRPKARGSSRPIGTGPSAVSTSSAGPPCSQSSCRHRPHGSSGPPSASTQANADQPPAAGRVQRRDQPALGAQAQPVRGVLDVAADHDPAVVDERGRTDREVRVRRVGPAHRLDRRRPQPGPVDGRHPASPRR